MFCCFDLRCARGVLRSAAELAAPPDHHRLHLSVTNKPTPRQSPTTAANDGCTDAITGYSATFGRRDAAKLSRFGNQTDQWRAKGAITKVNAYFSPTAGCLQGIKATYGYNSADAVLLGAERGLATKDISLGAGEFFNKVQVRNAR